MTVGSESASYEETVSLSDNEPDEIYVYVCGAVVSPGVYTLASGSHVFEALEMAGGLRDDAAVDAVNQAERLTDGEQLKVPTKDEAAAELTITQSAEEDDGRININTATAEELTGLKGIGESRANDIIEYRNEHGSFKDIEDIKNVTGIKAGLYAKIKDYIKI